MSIPEGSVSIKDVTELSDKLSKIGPNPLATLAQSGHLTSKLRSWLEQPSCFDSEVAYQHAKSIAEFLLKQ